MLGRVILPFNNVDVDVDVDGEENPSTVIMKSDEIVKVMKNKKKLFIMLLLHFISGPSGYRVVGVLSRGVEIEERLQCDDTTSSSNC